MDFMNLVLIFGGAAIGLAAGCLVMMSRAARAKAELAAAIERASWFKEQLEAAAQEKQELQQHLETTRTDAAQQREKLAAATAQKEALEKRLAEQPEELKKMQTQLNLEFNKAAGTLFEEITKKFSSNSEKQIGDLLNPLRERIGEFQKLVTESFTTQGKEQHTLKAEIERIVNMNEQMRLSAEGLTKALKGDVKAQGNWGEVILERILEESGLQKSVGYTVQGMDMGLVSAEGGRQQPDVIVHLPDSKHIIIDSKVSLTHYERYCSEADEAQKAVQLKAFLGSVRAHVAGLEGKRYQDNEKLGTPDFVLMFMPIEGAYSLAVQQDMELHSYAWGKKIVLVCPSTLFATLRTIASLWRIEQQNRNADEIAKRGGQLYDKFVGFVEDMKIIGGRLSQAQSTYDDAMGKLAQGTGNLVGQAEKLRQLGVKTTKALPKDIIKDENAA